MEESIYFQAHEENLCGALKSSFDLEFVSSGVFSRFSLGNLGADLDKAPRVACPLLLLKAGGYYTAFYAKEQTEFVFLSFSLLLCTSLGSFLGPGKCNK